jgi:23S rRNA (cytosine1962-C5)-methyltransferase
VPNYAVLTIRAERDKSLRRQHPWIFSGAVERVTGAPQSGEIVEVRTPKGEFLAWASYSLASQITGRVWSFDPAAVIDDSFVAARILAAAARRDDLLTRTNGARLVFAESDGVPGLIADRYDSTVVIEVTAAASERWLPTITATLAALPGVDSVYERSELEVRSREGLEPRSGLLAGVEPPPMIELAEHRARLLVDVRHGHKTGFYLDQRDARAALAEVVKGGDRVLNVFAYTGAFSVSAGLAGAGEIVNIDSSGPALAVADQNLVLNSIAGATSIEADAFTELRKLRDRGQSFDVVVLDPPKLATSSRPEQLNRSTRAYKDLNLLAFKLLRPGGRLVTFSCSGAVSDDLFQKVVAGAALDARRQAAIVQHLHQASDHPVHLAVPETSYLKGLVCQVLD